MPRSLIRPESDAEEYIAYLEKEVEVQKTRRLEAMKALRKQSESIVQLIREKEIDRISCPTQLERSA